MDARRIDPAAITLPPTESVDITAYLELVDKQPANKGRIA